MKVKCPEEKPFLCIPHGVCCSPEQYCSRDSKTCESCFRGDLQNHPEKLLQWCRDADQYNASNIEHPSCQLACQARFINSSVLSNYMHDVTTDAVHFWDNWHIGLFVTAIVLLVTVLLILIFPRVRTFISQKSKTKKIEEEKKLLGVHISDVTNNQVAERVLDIKVQRRISQEDDEQNTSNNQENPADMLLLKEIPHLSNEKGQTPNPTSESGYGSSSPSSGSQKSNSSREEDIQQWSSNSHQEHPAAREQKEQRNLHFPTTEPDDKHRGELVTSHSFYSPTAGIQM